MNPLSHPIRVSGEHALPYPRCQVLALLSGCLAQIISRITNWRLVDTGLWLAIAPGDHFGPGRGTVPGWMGQGRA